MSEKKTEVSELETATETVCLKKPVIQGNRSKNIGDKIEVMPAQKKRLQESGHI